MNLNDGSFILSNLIGAALGALGIWAFIVRPYQDKFEKSNLALADATAELQKFRALNLDKELTAHAHRLSALEDRERLSSGALPESHVTLATLIRSEEHRDREFSKVNQKLDDGLRNDAKHAEAIDTLKRQIDTAFKLWNQEHKR